MQVITRLWDGERGGFWDFTIIILLSKTGLCALIYI